MNDLSNKLWFITGASAGFGRALCEQVIARGGRLLATARDVAALADLAAMAPERVALAPLDVTNPAQIAAAVALAEARFGGIDVLVNNAGYGYLGAIEEASDAEVRAQFDVNFFGLAALTRAVLPSMRARRSGKIINMSSTAGTRGNAGVGYYAASKWAVEALSEALAQEGAPFGIGVLIVEPGPFRTNFSGSAIAHPAHPIPAYEGAAAARAWSASLDGTQAGDPVRAAALIVDTAIQREPPLRLILGRQAFDGACTSIQLRLDDMQRSRTIAPAADFPA
ncbi:oxidoreductase [Massilia cavernae]|uniref:SDR family NAD(P)-dependent oxidoreductase n=1 Tax=Massilia cavernae TaxID=2320864 RepID=A0A418X740_9BURK|nr:oxidoreductase [Massilia cavernae]RJG08270.1 SDR family NAD(P)-dependent oxidoreductase [Massilia cavernae]